MDFPIEILEKILSFLDGRSLCRACQVNRTWNHEVERLIKKQETWQRCIKELPKTDLIELTTNLDYHLPPSPFDNEPSTCLLKDWNAIYINWWMWRHISRWQTETTSFYSPKEVTCAKLSGDCIVTGHASGEIRVWNFTGKLLGFCHTHRLKVKDLVLVAFGLGDRLQAVKGTEINPSSKLRPLLGLAHYCVISTSQEEELAITYFTGIIRTDGAMMFQAPDYFHHWSNDQLPVIAAHAFPTTDYILIVVDNGLVQIGELYRGKWSFDIFGNGAKLILKRELEFEFPGVLNLKSISCHPPKIVTALTTYDSVQSFIRVDLDEADGKFTFTRLRPANVFMQDVNIFRANFCLWIENRATTQLHIHTNGVTINHEVRPALSSVPVCYLLHCSILFLGTSMGSVLAFDARNLPELDLSRPLWTTQLQCGPIRAIHVAGGSFGMRLIAAGRQKVSLIEFNASHCMAARSSHCSDHRDENLALRVDRNLAIE